MKQTRTIRNLLLGMAASLVMATSAQAQTASYMDTPLMVVRFNQDRIYYQQPLYNAVANALQAKPSVMFSIISLVPQTGDKYADEKLDADARRSTALFVNDMRKMGVPESRIRVDYQQAPNVTSNEVHLFVE